MADEDEEQSNGKTLMIFGRDVSKIPCFRNSFLYGITGGLGFGLAYFMFTSKPRHATNFAVYSFSLITMAYWIQCRFTFSKNRFEMMKMQELLSQQRIYEGTVAEKDLDARIEKVDA